MDIEDENQFLLSQVSIVENYPEYSNLRIEPTYDTTLVLIGDKRNPQYEELYLSYLVKLEEYEEALKWIKTKEG